MIVLNEKRLGRLIGNLAKTAHTVYPEKGLSLLNRMLQKETNEISRRNLKLVIENHAIAKERNLPKCQSPGVPIVYYKIGTSDSIKIEGDIYEAARKGVQLATSEAPLRPSICDVITRKNTGDNTGRHVPAVDIDFLPDQDFVEIHVMAYVGMGDPISIARNLYELGSEFEILKGFVLDWVIQTAFSSSPCAPYYIGIGIGGTMDECVKLARNALMRPMLELSSDSTVAQLEQELVADINTLEIGCGGLGGYASTVGVHIERADSHVSAANVSVLPTCTAFGHAAARILADDKIEYITG